MFLVNRKNDLEPTNKKRTMEASLLKLLDFYKRNLQQFDDDEAPAWLERRISIINSLLSAVCKDESYIKNLLLQTKQNIEYQFDTQKKFSISDYNQDRLHGEMVKLLEVFGVDTKPSQIAPPLQRSEKPSTRRDSIFKSLVLKPSSPDITDESPTP